MAVASGVGLAHLSALTIAVSPIDRIAGVPLELRPERLSGFWRSVSVSWQESVATLTLVLAIGWLVYLAGGLVADLRRWRPSDSRLRAWALAGLGVLAWSVFVRFQLCEPNIFTDGGSGYGRVLRYIEGYGGLATLVKLLPASRHAFLWEAMVVPRLLASLAPAALVWVAWGLRLSPAAGLLAGMALASLPIHAVLSSSDLLVGPMSTVQLVSVAAILAARSSQRADLFAAGLALAGWGIWFRPEGALGLLPVAAAALTLPTVWWRRIGPWSALAVLALIVALRAAALATGRTAGAVGGYGSFSNVAWGSLATSTILLPYWLWLPLPFALAELWRRRALAVVVAGAAAGFLPIYLRGMYPDPADTHLEALRYGVPLMPWLALAAATGVDTVLRALRARFGERPYALATSVAVLGLAASTFAHGEYLGRRYGHAASEAAIRELLAGAPEGCTVLVPDDHPEAVSIEIHHRYAIIAAEAYALGSVPALRIVPASETIEAVDPLRECWMYLKGPYCYHAFDGIPARACTEVERRFNLEEVARVEVEFRHHRLVSGPAVHRRPWYMGEMPIVLYRILEQAPLAGTSAG